MRLKYISDPNVWLRWGSETLEDDFECLGACGVTKDATVHVLGRLLGGSRRQVVPRTQGAAQSSGSDNDGDDVGFSGDEDEEEEEEPDTSDEEFLDDGDVMGDSPLMHTALDQESSLAREDCESAMSVTEQYHQAMHAVRGLRSRASGARQEDEELPNTSQLPAEHVQSQQRVQEYETKLRALIDQDKMFSVVFALAESLMADPQPCASDGSCLAHRRTETGECILDTNVMQGVQALQENSSPGVTYTLLCEVKEPQLSASVVATGSVCHLTLTSPQLDLEGIYQHLGDALRQSRDQAKKLQTELKQYNHQVFLSVAHMAQSSGLKDKINQHLEPDYSLNFKTLYQQRKPKLCVLSKTQKDYNAMLSKLRSPSAAMLARQARHTETLRRSYKNKKQQRQQAKNHDKALRNLAISNRTYKKQAPTRREDETQEQYCSRRLQELKHCSNPQPVDVQDFEKSPAAALVAFYMKSRLPPRHEPPACLTEDVLMVHDANVFDCKEWADSDIEIFQAFKTLSTIAQEGKWLQTAADLRYALHSRAVMESAHQDKTDDAGVPNLLLLRTLGLD